jgi:hypothetical protein
MCAIYAGVGPLGMACAMSDTAAGNWLWDRSDPSSDSEGPGGDFRQMAGDVERLAMKTAARLKSWIA